VTFAEAERRDVLQDAAFGQAPFSGNACFSSLRQDT